MKLNQIKGEYTVARYAPDATLTPLYSRQFCTVTRTPTEVSLVCESDLVPPGWQKREDGWACLHVDGLLDFSLTGIIAKISKSLADDHIAIFVVSTFDTDYVLVKHDFLVKAAKALQKAGYEVSF